MAEKKSVKVGEGVGGIGHAPVYKRELKSRGEGYTVVVVYSQNCRLSFVHTLD